MISNRTQIQNAKQTFNTHTGRPLIGIYNIVDKSITLFPCMSERVRLDEDAHGVFTQGIYIDEDDTKIKLFTNEELAEANHLGYAPRYLDLPLGTTSAFTGATFLSAHEYVVRLMGVTTLEKVVDLRGFTVTQKSLGSEPVFSWASGSLNSLRDESGELLERIRGCQLAPSLQKEIKNIIVPWCHNPSIEKNSGKKETACQKITKGSHDHRHSLLFRSKSETIKYIAPTTEEKPTLKQVRW